MPTHGDQGGFRGQLGPWAPGHSEEILLGTRAPGRQRTNIGLPRPRDHLLGQRVGARRRVGWSRRGKAVDWLQSPGIRQPPCWSVPSCGREEDTPWGTGLHAQMQLQASLTSVLGPQKSGEPCAPASEPRVTRHVPVTTRALPGRTLLWPLPHAWGLREQRGSAWGI